GENSGIGERCLLGDAHAGRRRRGTDQRPPTALAPHIPIRHRRAEFHEPPRISTLATNGQKTSADPKQTSALGGYHQPKPADTRTQPDRYTLPSRSITHSPRNHDVPPGTRSLLSSPATHACRWP